MTGLLRFSGRTVLITGAGYGIGRACAFRLAAEGARTAVTDLDESAARAVAAELPGPDGVDHAAYPMDVTDTDSVNRTVDQVAADLGGLDVLINVAGGDTMHGAFEETEDEVWARMLDLNLLGVVRCCRAATPHLRRSTRAPGIVTISSINGLTALGSEPYSAAKAGLSSLTTNLAHSLGRDGIRVNAVAPATIKTRVWDDQPGGADRLRGLYPLGRVGEPDDVAAAVAFLASSDAAWITGHVLPVDGGLLTSHGSISQCRPNLARRHEVRNR
ncbi:SDR family NAD(P)-dependent oxidoreductase [Microlunatus speluncae]|uniref:SDR family NAD(P)-dependent oxidoreductase n=1 Tax=Microlunatus speluncae TaxID=2594267 RepID=UPI0012663558|nr:SDR family oxidoreductase [Microlunatus speluncae]